MLSQIVASQFLALFVHDESDDTVAGSMISDRSLCRKDLVCVIAQLARSVLDSPYQDLPRCFLESKPLQHNRREQTNLATLLTTLCARGVNN